MCHKAHPYNRTNHFEIATNESIYLGSHPLDASKNIHLKVWRLYSKNNPEPEMVVDVVPVAIVCCVCVSIALGALFTLFTLARQKDDEKIKQNLATYEDDDGVATPEAIAAFSDLVPRLTLAASSIAGLIASIGLLYGRNDWLDWTCWVSVAAWVVVLIQTAALNGLKSPVLRFNVGLSLAIQAAVITAYSLYNGYDDLEGSAAVIVVAQAFFGFSTWLAAVSIPRRPDVERDGQIVDGMWTSSAFDRWDSYVSAATERSLMAVQIHYRMGKTISRQGMTFTGTFRTTLLTFG